MLQSIRDHTQGWIAGVIISLVILSFVLFGIHSYFSVGNDGSVVAKVNGVVISKTQLAAAFERLRNQTQTNMGSANLPQHIEADLKLRALQALISVQVLKQGSLAQKYRISSRQIDGFLASMPEFQVNGEFSLRRFQQLLSSGLFTAGEFLELIKTTLLIDQPRLGILFSSFTLPNEVENTISLVNQERDVAYMALPKSYFLAQVAPISDAETEAYYKAHQDDYKTPEQVSVEYVELSVKDLMAAIHSTDEQLKKFYNENINSYTQAPSWTLEQILVPVMVNATAKDVSAAEGKANELLSTIKNGTDFSKLAHQYPDSTANSKTAVTLAQLPIEMQKPLSSLTKPGQLTDVIKTQKGFVIAKVINYQDAKVSAFDVVKEKVREALARQQAEEQFTEQREKLANVTYEHPDSLQSAVQTLNLPIKTSVLFTAEKGGSDISSVKKVRDATFSEDVLSSQNNSDPIQLTPDSVVVLRVKSHIPASLLALSVVRKQIQEALLAQKADLKAAEMAKQIQQKLQSGVTTDQVAQQFHFAWNKLGYIGRYSTKVDSAILYTAFRLPRPQGSAVSYARTKIPSGFAVVAVAAVRDGHATNKEQSEVFTDQIQNSVGLLEYKLYEQSLIKKAKIVNYLNNNVT